MEVEWDEENRQEILTERGIDIRDVALIFEEPERLLVWRDDRKDYGEVRFIALGLVDGAYYRLAFALRGEVTRLITAWKIRDVEYEEHKARLAQTVEGDEE